MGQIAGTTEIAYKTRNGIPIKYIFYDLKGSNRYPQQPQNQLTIEIQFQQCLKDIQVTQQQLSMVRDFNPKYKFRFVIMHQRKIQQHYKSTIFKNDNNCQNHLLRIDLSSNHQNQKDRKREELQLRIKEVQQPNSSLKISLASLIKYITEHSACCQFVQSSGPQRLIKLLQEQINNNKKSLKTNFAKQIDILRFLKTFSTQYPREYYLQLLKCENYGDILMNALHPVCVPATAYALSLLEDYIWRAENCKSIINIIKQYAERSNCQGYLSIFCEILQSSNNVLMVYYLLKFINELVVTTVNDQERIILREQIDAKKYSLVLENIKYRLESNFYKLQYATFIYVSQQIYKFVSRGKQEYKQSIINPQDKCIARQTISIKDLQQHLIANCLQFQPQSSFSDQLQEQEFLTVYISQSGQKQFHKFLLNVLAQIRNYYKIERYVYEDVACQNLGQNNQTYEQKLSNKVDDLKMEEFLKYIRMNCIKNDCTETMFGCLKNLQYYDRQQWRKLDSHVLEELGLGTSRKEVMDSQVLQALKQSLKDKDDQIRKLIKQISQLKAQIKKINQQAKQLQNRPHINFLSLANTSVSNSQSEKYQHLEVSNTFILPPLPPPPPLLQVLLPSPPLLSSNSSAVKLPPLPQIPLFGGPLPIPPPIGGTTPSKSKEKKQPKVPLKNCNYAPVPYQKIANSIWSQINEDSVWLNFEQIQTLFAKKVNEKSCQDKLQETSAKPKKEIIKLLSSQRWRNFQIVLTKLKIPKNGITTALIQCTGKYSNPSVLESVAKILPKDDQQETIRMFIGDESALGVPQAFLKQLIVIPAYRHRIVAMLFASTKDQHYYDLQHKIESLIVGFNSFRQDYRFHHILELTLALGNYLNGASFKGGAWGIKVDSISKLEDVKSVDNKMNAAFYVINQAWKRFEYPIIQNQELEMYQDLSKISISQIKADLDQLHRTLQSIEKAEASNGTGTANQNDNIGLLCQQMRMELKAKLQLFNQKYIGLEKAFKECSQFYCEDSSNQGSDQIGKKFFNSILYLSNTEKTLRIVQQQQKRLNSKKPLFNVIRPSSQCEPKDVLDLRYSQSKYKQTAEKPDKASRETSYLPKPKIHLSQEQRFEQFQRNQDNVLKDMMKKREQKLSSMFKHR